MDGTTRRKHAGSPEVATGALLSSKQTRWRYHPPGFRGAVRHRIRQPARAAYQRQRAVFQTIELRQAAGLETARHQNHVCAAHDAVRERFVIANLHAHLPRMFRRGREETFLQYRVARAEQRKLPTLLQ